MAMKEVYWEIKINNLSGPRQAKFWQKSGPRFVYFDLPIYFLHEIAPNNNRKERHQKYFHQTKSVQIQKLVQCRVIIKIVFLSFSHQSLSKEQFPSICQYPSCSNIYLYPTSDAVSSWLSTHISSLSPNKYLLLPILSLTILQFAIMQFLLYVMTTIDPIRETEMMH